MGPENPPETPPENPDRLETMTDEELEIFYDSIIKFYAEDPICPGCRWHPLECQCQKVDEKF